MGRKSLTALCPSEFFALYETQVDTTATEEALDKRLWHDVLEDMPPASVLSAKVGIPLTSACNAKSDLCAESTIAKSGAKTSTAVDVTADEQADRLPHIENKFRNFQS